jgi:hypothetical protein
MHSIFVIVSTITPDGKAAALSTYEINGIGTEAAARDIAQEIRSRFPYSHGVTNPHVATVCYEKQSS